MFLFCIFRFDDFSVVCLRYVMVGLVVGSLYILITSKSARLNDYLLGPGRVPCVDIDRALLHRHVIAQFVAIHAI